jgi:hypothetical protein
VRTATPWSLAGLLLTAAAFTACSADEGLDGDPVAVAGEDAVPVSPPDSDDPASGSATPDERDGEGTAPEPAEVEVDDAGGTPAPSDAESCDVTGSFTSDESGYTLERPTLEELDAFEYEPYELDGSAGMEVWEAYGEAGDGPRGPNASYFVAFYDGEVGYRAGFVFFEDEPHLDRAGVRRFTEALEVRGGPESETVVWEVPSDQRDFSGMALDGSGGTVTLLTTMGEVLADTPPIEGRWFHPLRVELEFDCPV